MSQKKCDDDEETTTNFSSKKTGMVLVLTLDQLNGRYTNKALLMVVFACARALLSLKLQIGFFYKYLHPEKQSHAFLSAQRTKKSKSQK